MDLYHASWNWKVVLRRQAGINVNHKTRDVVGGETKKKHETLCAMNATLSQNGTGILHNEVTPIKQNWTSTVNVEGGHSLHIGISHTSRYTKKATMGIKPTYIYIYMWQGPFGIMRPSSFLIPFVSILVSLSVPNLSPYFSISIAILLSGRFRSKESPCLPFHASLSIAQCSSFWWLSG